MVIAAAVLSVAKGRGRMAQSGRLRRESAETSRPTEATAGGRSSPRILEDAVEPRVTRCAGGDGSLHPGLQQLARLLARRSALRYRRGLGASSLNAVTALMILALLMLALFLLTAHFNGH